MTAQPSLTFIHLSKTFASRNGNVNALSDINALVAAGEFVCIVGPSGCGKSTLLKIVAGLAAPTSGTVEFNASGEGVVPNALVFQEHGLYPWMTLLDNVAFGLEMQGVAKSRRREQALAFLTQVGLQGFARHYPHELSVGMRQRGAIARAFLANPKVLLMDEPFSALDAQSKIIFQEELLRVWRKTRKTVLYVTHDIEEAVMLADRVWVMSGRPGRIIEEIAVRLERPRNRDDAQRAEVERIRWNIWKVIESEVRQSLTAMS